MPQPIDMQTELGRLLTAERMQDAARASLAAMHRSQAEDEARRRVQETQVDETPEAQSEHVDGDGRGKKDGKSRRRRRAGAAVEDKRGDASGRPGGDHRLDVSI